MVLLEAAKSVCEISLVLGNSVDSALAVLQMLLGSSKSVVKYAALKVLNSVAAEKPSVVLLCSSELENMINHPNRSVASLAISALLKTCKAHHIHGLLQTIIQYLPDSGEEFRVDIIRAVKQLARRYPEQYKVK